MKWLFFIIFFPSLAAPANEPWAGVVQEAQKLAIGKNRKQATEKLVASLKNDKWSSKGRAKLIETLKSLAEVFFTDQGQRLYETGQSLAYETPDTAMTRFREALEKEDGNSIILLAMARLQLSKKECAGAGQTLKLAAEINPFDSMIRFLQAKTLLCQHKAMEALALLKNELPSDDVVTNTTLASAMLDAGSSEEATGLLRKAAIKDTAFPEVHYWLWKSSEDKDGGADDQGEKYVALCKNMSQRTRRKYMNEPRLCGQTQEVEDALKASQKSSDT